MKRFYSLTRRDGSPTGASGGGARSVRTSLVALLVLLASALTSTLPAGATALPTTLTGPVFYPGNVTTCTGLNSVLGASALPALATDTTYPTSPDQNSHSNGLITGTVTNSVLTVVSAPNVTVDYVVVKGGAVSPGNPGYNVYTGPAANLDGTQQFLSPHGFSHWFVCYHTSKVTPTVATTPNVSGTSATDSVTVSGTSGTPTGTVTFALFGVNGQIGSNSAPISLSAGTATSPSFTSLAPGSYHFVATYSGDGTYTTLVGANENITIASPPVFIPPTASLNTSPTVNGTSATDSATVSGSSGTPTGSVTFTLFSGAPGSGTLVAGYAADTVALANGQASSASTGNLATGNYYFMTTYSGDGTYTGITPGTPEPFTIAQQSATLGTFPTVTGLSAGDSATVSATSGTPTGSVTFTLFSGAPGSGTPVAGYAADTVALISGQASSVATGTLAAGNYYFLVTYSGDSNYSSIMPGTPEPFTIIAVSPAPKPPKPPKTPKPPKKSKGPAVPPYRIPNSAPTTGLGGTARMMRNGSLLAGGGSIVLAGLMLMAYAQRRRRQS